jgi:hypothetical protein
MNQALTILLSAVIVGLISIAVLCMYTNTSAAKMPEQNDMIQIFISGAVVASFVSWLVTSGMLHGNSLFNMISTDVSTIVKDIDNSLKGGNESIVNEITPSNNVTDDANTSSKKNSMNIPAISGMVGGFFKSMGLDSNTLQELTVGMPSF